MGYSPGQAGQDPSTQGPPEGSLGGHQLSKEARGGYRLKPIGREGGGPVASEGGGADMRGGRKAPVPRGEGAPWTPGAVQTSLLP